MAVIDYIDPINRLIYLHADTLNSEVQPVDIYKEMRTLRRTDESLRSYDIFLAASGYVSKGGGKYTPRLITCLLGTRIVPYDASGELTITGEIITDEGTSGLACFDRTPLSPTTYVDINYIPPQVEIIEIVSGSGVTEQDKLDIADRVWDEDRGAGAFADIVQRIFEDVTYPITSTEVLGETHLTIWTDQTLTTPVRTINIGTAEVPKRIDVP